MLHHIPPGSKAGATVVEDGVQHHPDAVVVGGADQTDQVCLGAEIGVNPGVVGGVVLVDTGRGEKGVEIEAGDAQLGQVGELGGDAGQVPAEPVGVGDGAPPPGQSAGPSAAAPAEPVGKNLIPDGMADPFGGRNAVGGIHPGHGEALDPVVQLEEGTEPVLVVVPARFPLVHRKAVAEAAVGRTKGDGPQLVVFQGKGGPHGGPAALPGGLAAGDAALIGIGVDQFHSVDVPAGPQGDLQCFGVQGAAHGRPRLMIDGSQIHRWLCLLVLIEIRP